MSKKDYELIASAISTALKGNTGPMFKYGVIEAATLIADALARDNPRFNRLRFLEACGAV